MHQKHQECAGSDCGEAGPCAACAESPIADCIRVETRNASSCYFGRIGMSFRSFRGSSDPRISVDITPDNPSSPTSNGTSVGNGEQFKSVWIPVAPFQLLLEASKPHGCKSGGVLIIHNSRNHKGCILRLSTNVNNSGVLNAFCVL